jgi:hypothetical protein
MGALHRHREDAERGLCLHFHHVTDRRSPRPAQPKRPPSGRML